MWEGVHGVVHYNCWHRPAELFRTINQRMQDEFSILENSDYNFYNWLLCLSSSIVLLAVQIV